LHLEKECGVMVLANQMSPLKNGQLLLGYGRVERLAAMPGGYINNQLNKAIYR